MFLCWIYNVVIPNVFAFCSFSSRTSTSIIFEAPNALAICKQLEWVIKLKGCTIWLEPTELIHGQHRKSTDSQLYRKWVLTNLVTNGVSTIYIAFLKFLIAKWLAHIMFCISQTRTTFFLSLLFELLYYLKFNRYILLV